jgi:hypothetical protein
LHGDLGRYRIDAFSLTRLIIAWRVWEFRPRRVPI